VVLAVDVPSGAALGATTYGRESTSSCRQPYGHVPLESCSLQQRVLRITLTADGTAGNRGLGSTGLRWPTMAVEMEPEGILLHLLSDEIHTGSEPRADSSLWHVADVERALTWCGIDVGYGNPRRRWSETPEDQRCQMCMDRLQRGP
jgi:hypothetical protein